VSGSSPVRVASVSATAPDGWDRDTVAAPGGNVLQGTCWAAHRRAQGARPMFVTFTDGRAALVIARRQRGLGGLSAACRKGPIHAGDPPEAIASRAAALATMLREKRATDLFLDPEIDQSSAYETAMEGAGFGVTDEAQPSIHVMRLALPAGCTETELFPTLGKTTRQRIHAAEKAGIRVRIDEKGDRLGDFAALLGERGRDLGFHLGAEFGSMAFTGLLISAGQARLYVAEHEDELVGGLVVHLQGGTFSTAHSADRVDLRHTYPGTMHLVRWTIIRDALGAGAPWIDLGGVDLPGHRQLPAATDPTYGLYEHKRGFGAAWAAREPARRIVLRPWVDRVAWLGRGVSALPARLRRREAAW
jgi:lipid II:glycine glycyltransferase (peptidoglycan interpeptide bridge formation enzyme)